MENTVYTFRRVEKKYAITKEKQAAMLARLAQQLVPDSHGNSTVCSLYLDTPDWRLIRGSIYAGAYKEKLRLRSYGTPDPKDPVFLEIKKKYKGIVYKRRVQLPLGKAMDYIHGGEKPCTGQIMEEIDYAMHFYRSIQPSMLIACEREAYFGREDPGLRLTFDTNIRYRQKVLVLDGNKDGTCLLGPEQVLLEIKTGGAMPLWLTRALNELQIYPSRFSKYAKAYEAILISKGVYNNA